MDDGFDMEPVDDGFGAPDPHTEGNRALINEVSDEESENILRERIGVPEDHGDGEHLNVNISLENDETGASEAIDNIHSYSDDL